MLAEQMLRQPNYANATQRGCLFTENDRSINPANLFIGKIFHILDKFCPCQKI
jgi:hypothetical protein